MNTQNDNTKLRALSGTILLIISLTSLTLARETESTKLIMITLSAFLVGGSVLNNSKQKNND